MARLQPLLGEENDPASPFQFWEPNWRQFSISYSDWLSGFPADDAIYCLPEAAIDDARRGHRLPLNFDVELAFTRLCERYGRAVGVMQGEAITYGLLSPSAPPSREAGEAVGWSPADQRAVAAAFRSATEVSQRLLGAAGWLRTEPAYLDQVIELKAIWTRLPVGERPTFPLRRSLPVRVLPAGAAQASSDRSLFAASLDRLLDRWGLVNLVSWELPDPQGPLLPLPWAAGSPGQIPAQPAHGVYVFVPVHYPVQQNDPLLSQILEYQRQAADAQGVDRSFAGLARHEGYAMMFRVLHLEDSIRARFPREGASPRGPVTAIEGAVAAALELSVDSVKKYRKLISASRRGRRPQARISRPSSP